MKKKGEFSYSTRRKIVIGVAIVLLAFLYLFRNLSSIFLTAAAITLILLFYLIDSLFDVKFKSHHYFFVIFIAIAGILLSPIYNIYPSYDKILHFIQPIMLSSMIFYMISNLDIKLKWKITFTFFIAIGIVGLFEIGEYALDSFFDLRLQGVFLRELHDFGQSLRLIQEPLDDTMIDMILGTIGSLVYALAAIFFFKKRRN
jgi:membrane-associated HD superfamily phosphohydrolase